MAEITQVNGRPVVDYMARDYASLLQAMYDLIPHKLPEWQDYANQADFGNVLLQLFAHIGDILSYYQDRVANESFLSTAVTRRSVIEHLRLIGYKLATPVPAAAKLSLSVPETVNSKVTISQGDAFATKSQKNRPSVRFEYTGKAPLTIDFGAIAPVAGRKTFAAPTNGIPAEEGRLIKDEVLGISSGKPNQRFRLARPRLILRPSGPAQETTGDILLLTQLGQTVESWTLQESLAFSRAKQKDFVVEIDEDDQATVIFGDGSFGLVPPSGAVITATYRVGGGLAGNVPANAIQTIVNAPELALLGATVINPGPATGGAERESIDHAVRHAPSVFRSLGRAVTADDYEALALSLKGVGKVRAKATGWNQVTLFVAPEGGGKVSDVLEAHLKAFFEDKRTLGQIVEVEDVDYVPICVTAEIGIESYYMRADVRTRVQEAAARLLAFDQVDFGKTLYLSKFYEEAEKVAGVLYLHITEFRRKDRPEQLLEPSGKIELGPNEIPVIPSDPRDPRDREYSPGMKVVFADEGGF